MQNIVLNWAELEAPLNLLAVCSMTAANEFLNGMAFANMCDRKNK